MSLQHFLNNLFDTRHYSLALSLQRLRNFGGISCLLNSLSISNRQQHTPFPGLRDQDPDQERSQTHKAKRNEQKKNIFLENILLYFITLSFFVKLLLYKNAIRESLDVYTEIIGFSFLIMRIYERKLKFTTRQSSNYKQDYNDIDKDKIYRIKRKGDQTRVTRQDIQKGDIIFYQKDDIIQFNCIILQIVHTPGDTANDQNNVIVNQDQTDTGRNKCRKDTVWNAEQINLLDPFIFKNTRLIDGKIWALICQSKLQFSREHQREIQMNGLLQLSRTGRKIDQVIQITVVFVVIWISINWQLQKLKNNYEVLLQFVYLISCLTLYLSYVNYNEIFVLIQRYLKDCITAKGNGYKIMNSKIIEQLEQVDLILIQEDCLNTIDFNMLTEINSKNDLKLITTKSINYIYRQFGVDFNDELLFKTNVSYGNSNYSKILEQLAKSKVIIIEQNYEKSLKYVLEIFSQMNFKVIFVGKSRKIMRDFPDMISILSRQQDISQEHLDGEWVRIISSQPVQDVLLELVEKAQMYKALKQIYYSIMFNSCLQIIILLIWALNGCLISLNLNLLIMYFDNNQIYKFYKNIISKNYVTKKRSKFNPLSVALQFNITMLIYYVFMMYQIYKSPDRDFQLFLWLMVNRLFRLEGLGKEIDTEQWRRRFKAKMLGMLILDILQIGLAYYQQTELNYINQLLDIMLLPSIMIIYYMFI